MRGRCPGHIALQGQQLGQPLEADGKTGRRGRFATQLFHQPVKTPAGAYRRLRAELVGGPFEHSAGVVVEPTHQTRVDGNRHARIAQIFAKAREMGARALVQIILQVRRSGDDLAHGGILAVEDAQRIFLQPPQAVFIETVAPCREIARQFLTIGGARCRRAQRVKFQDQPFEPERTPQTCAHQDEFGIEVRRLNAKGLDTDLVKLPITALLRPLMAEHRARVPQTLNLVVQESVLDPGAHAAGRALGPQGEILAVAVLEAVHLLLDDVGLGADGAREQLGFLDEGQADFAVAVGRQHLARRRLDALPALDRLRQQIVHAAYGLYGLAQWSALNRPA